MAKKNNNQPNTLQEVEKLLAQQTLVILDAVDKKLERTEKIFKKEINGLMTSVDKFVGFYEKQDQEFLLMNAHVKSLEERIQRLEAKVLQ